MHITARRPIRIVVRGAPSAALAVAIAFAALTPCVRAAPTVAAPAMAASKANAQPAAATPAPAPPAAAPTAPVVGTLRPPLQRAPLQPLAPAISAASAPTTASMAPAARTLLRDALLLTGQRYVRTVVIPSGGTVQVIAQLRGSCDATLSFEPTSVTGGDRLSADLRAPAANPRHGATLVGQRVLREYQVTAQQVANGGSFLVSITPVAATRGSVPSELSFEINLK